VEALRKVDGIQSGDEVAAMTALWLALKLAVDLEVIAKRVKLNAAKGARAGMRVFTAYATCCGDRGHYCLLQHRREMTLYEAVGSE
jgi:hypothetical protein